MIDNSVLHGNNLDILPTIPENSVDSIVTDPPYELGFMGKKWDASGIAYNVELWRECLRVLKPGGHLLAFGGTRTYHRMVVAIEDAGFEIRDSIHWVYGSGFPKSLDVSKAIDKAAGAKREVIATLDVGPDIRGNNYENATGRMVADITVPSTDAAKRWNGWGTALKPAHEPIVVARKTVDGTVASNVLKHGTGALNIDGCRIRRADDDVSVAGNRTATFGTQETRSGGDGSGGWKQDETGRWPANVIHDGSPEVLEHFPDTAARFFYCAKPSKAERNAGLDGMPEKRPDERSDIGMGTFVEKGVGKQSNFHPTVKPITLMRYLVRLVTPPNGTVLDPFAGSGTTLVAATLENVNSVGIELTADYLPIIEGRLAWAKEQTTSQQPVLPL